MNNNSGHTVTEEDLCVEPLSGDLSSAALSEEISSSSDAFSSAKADDTPADILKKETVSLALMNADLEYQINLDFFTGPMDLLLHLVSQREVSIEQVSMKDVLDQYLAIVLEQSDSIDLERASEYLVIAATLMVIKSRALLPNEQVEDDVTDDLPEYSRFFEDLRARLIAYENTRIRAQSLIDAPQLDVDTFIRRDKSALSVPPEMLAEGEEPSRLGTLFHNLMKRVGGLSRTYRITSEPITIVSYMMRLVDNLKSPFIGGNHHLLMLATKLFRSSPVKESTRNIVLGSFVAVLELAKRGLIKVSQEHEYADLHLQLTMKDSDSTEFTSEFDNAESDTHKKDLSHNSDSESHTGSNLREYAEVANARR